MALLIEKAKAAKALAWEAWNKAEAAAIRADDAAEKARKQWEKICDTLEALQRAEEG